MRIIRYNIKNNNIILGSIILLKLKKTKYNRVSLYIYIRKQWRNKWLLKELSKKIYKDVYKLCIKFNIDLIITKAKNPKSVRILEFFKFIKYNNIYFKLVKY